MMTNPNDLWGKCSCIVWGVVWGRYLWIVGGGGGGGGGGRGGFSWLCSV